MFSELEAFICPYFHFEFLEDYCRISIILVIPSNESTLFMVLCDK